jgi:putative transposase
MRRKDKIMTGMTYHVYTKSIYTYVIFPSNAEYERMHNLLTYYQISQKVSFSHFLNSPSYLKKGIRSCVDPLPPLRIAWDPIVTVLDYCIMPTHLHLIIRQEKDNGIYDYLRRSLSGFSQFFNLRHNRRGPLWQGRFCCSLLEGQHKINAKIDYVLNNPVKDLGLKRAEDWPWSSLTKPLPTSGN